jgi:hypothetical protein
MSKVICDDCKNYTRVNSIRKFKGRFLCWNCYCKVMGETMPITPNMETLEEALNKIRIVRLHGSVKQVSGNLCLPRCLIGKKVKVVLA